MSKSTILNHSEIIQKLDRISSEILEELYGEKACVFVGLNERGYAIAQLLEALVKKGGKKSQTAQLTLSDNEWMLNHISVNDIKDNSVVIVDDVLESGRTMMNATAFIMTQQPKQIKTAVLVDRMHHKFPIRADYVGLTLSTTLQDHVEVEFNKKQEITAYLI